MRQSIYVTLDEDLALSVTGTETKAEDEVGLSQSFNIKEVELHGKVLDLIEWCEAQKGRALTGLEELCLAELNNR